MEERRRARRHDMTYAEFAGVPFSLTVQVMDISLAGVLLQSSQPVKVGVRGALRLTLGGQSLTTDVAVTRVSPLATGSDERYRIGAMFVAISPEHRQLIERFIN